MNEKKAPDLRRQVKSRCGNSASDYSPIVQLYLKKSKRTMTIRFRWTALGLALVSAMIYFFTPIFDQLLNAAFGAFGAMSIELALVIAGIFIMI